MKKYELTDWLRPYMDEAEIMIQIEGERLIPANIRYEYGKRTNYEGILVVYPSHENKE